MLFFLTSPGQIWSDGILYVLILNIENQKFHFQPKYVRNEISIKMQNRLLK